MRCKICDTEFKWYDYGYTQCPTCGQEYEYEEGPAIILTEDQKRILKRKATINQPIEKSALKDIQNLIQKYSERGVYIEDVSVDWRNTIGGEKYFIDFNTKFSNNKMG